MATLEELCAHGILLKHHPDMEGWEQQQRCIFLTPEVDEWLKNYLKSIRAKAGKAISPHEEVEQVLYDFVIGRPMAYNVDYKILDPLLFYIWELKTNEVRLFGWFYRKGHFIVCGGELKDNLSPRKQKKSTNALYKPFIDDAKDCRDSLSLDEPKYLTAVNRHEVL